MKPGLYTNDKGTSVVFATYVTPPPEFVEYHHLKPRIRSSWWGGRKAEDFLSCWPHRIEEIELIEGTGPTKRAKHGLYTNGKKIAFVYEIIDERSSKLVDYCVASNDDTIYTTATHDFLKIFPYRVTEIEVR